MKYGLTFALLGIAQLILATRSGWAGLLWGWSGLSFLAVATGYLWFGPGVFGKTKTGILPWWRVILLLPYLLLTWMVWHLQRRLTREDCCNEVSPNLWVGRRPFASEIPKGTKVVVDMTAEFPVSPRVKDGRAYVCVPTLDTSFPEREQLVQLVNYISTCSGPVYIHCASGHGRSAALAAAVMLSTGKANTVEDAERIIGAVRPRIGLSKCQRRTLTEACEQLCKAHEHSEKPA